MNALRSPLTSLLLYWLWKGSAWGQVLLRTLNFQRTVMGHGAYQSPPSPEKPLGLIDHGNRVQHMLQDLRADHQGEAGAPEWDVLGVGDDQLGIRRVFQSHDYHPRVDVEAYRVRGQLPEYQPGSASDIYNGVPISCAWVSLSITLMRFQRKIDSTPLKRSVTSTQS